MNFLIRIPLNFRKNNVTALIDTGAAVSVISLLVFQRLPSLGKNKLYNNHSLLFRSATGDELMVTGYFNLHFQIQGITFAHPFYVIRNITEECIIGMDFLSLMTVSFNGPERILTLGTEGKVIEIPFEKPLIRNEVNHISAISLPKLEHLERPERKALHEVLQKNEDCFAINMWDLGKTDVVKHTIVTTGPPVTSPPYRAPPANKEVIEKHVKELLNSGIISPSASPYSSPVIIVDKPDGGKRMVIDYRKLNKQTVKDRYPLPRIDDTIDALHGAKYFTTLDLLSGFYQVEIDEPSRAKTAFITPQGLYEFNRLPMGLANSPSVFQRALNFILRMYISIFCLIYLDDIIIYSKTLSEHLVHIEKVLKCLKAAGLKVKISKCQFAQTEVKYLGHIVSADGVRPNPEKVKSIEEFPSPKNVDELRTVVGMLSYYRKFIRNFAEIAHPMTKLQKKDIKFEWTSEQENAFKILKDKLTEPPILGYPSFQLPFIVYTDASGWGVGAVLSQKQDMEHPDRETVIAYTSRHLNEREAKWSTVEKEALAIVHAVTVFYPYLWGKQFTVVTDHNPLKWLMTMVKPTGRLMRWSLLLQEFDMEIQYRPGSKHGNADGLSRLPLPLEGTPSASSQEDPYVRICFIVEEWLTAQKVDPYCIQAKASMEEPEATKGLAMRLNEEKVITLGNGILAYNNGKIIVPRAMREDVMSRFHSHRLSGHLGLPKTLFRIKQRFTWPRMDADIKEFIEACLLCAKRKAHGTRKMPLQPMPVASYLWERIAMDIVGPVPESRKGNKYILVIGEYISRYVEAIALPDQTAPTIATAFIHTIILKHGLPTTVLTDQGSNFQSELMAHIYQELGIKQLRSSPYNPKCNGMVEKVNRVLVDMLTMYANDNPEGWCEHLPYAVFAYNTSLNASTKEIPFYVIFGRDPMEPSDLKPPNRYRLGDDVWDDFNWNWHRAIEASKENLKKAQDYQKRHYDTKARPISFNIGDLVLLREGKTLTGKFYFRYDGPYEIAKKISNKNYAIKQVGTTHEFVVSTDRLKKFGKRQENEQIDKNDKSNDTQMETVRGRDENSPRDAGQEGAQHQPPKRGRPRKQLNPPPTPLKKGIRTSDRPVRLPAKLRDPSVLIKY